MLSVKDKTTLIQPDRTATKICLTIELEARRNGKKSLPT